MKKVALAILVLGGIGFASCKKYNGCAQAEKGWIRDYTDSDTCGVLIELEDGTKLEPNNWAELNQAAYSDGDLVWVSFKEASGISKCGVGEIVKVKCLSTREF